MYGALPPSTRREQAALFNGDEASVAEAATDNDSERKGDLDQDEESSESGSRVSAHGREGQMKDDGADARRQSSPPQQPRGVLVASDAIGMGLNLNIRRVIFTSMHKYDGEHEERVNDGTWEREGRILQGWRNVIKIITIRATCRHRGTETAFLRSQADRWQGGEVSHCPSHRPCDLPSPV